MTWKSATNQFISFRRSRSNAARREINCRCVSNDNRGARRGDSAEVAKQWRATLHFSKLFQIWRVFLQAFPNKALAVFWDFNGLQAFKTQSALASCSCFQIFCRSRL